MDFDSDISPMLLKKLFCPLESFSRSRMKGHDRPAIVEPNNKKSIRHPNSISLQPDHLFAFRFGTIVLQYYVSTIDVTPNFYPAAVGVWHSIMLGDCGGPRSGASSERSTADRRCAA